MQVPRLVNVTDKLGRTPAWLASDAGHMAALSVLLAHGANVEIPDRDGRTCLQRACFHGHKEVIHIILKQEIRRQIDAADRWGGTAFFVACYAGQLKVVKMMISRGVAPDTSCADGTTPLFAAAQNGWVAVVAVLVKAGADINKTRRGGFAPLHVACQVRLLKL